MDVRKLSNALLRALLTGVHGSLKLYWLIRRPATRGAHALALTGEGRVLLVKLRYARGWRLPGGGMRADENPQSAVLRELQEEIGLLGFRDVKRVCELNEISDFKQDLASIFVLRDVTYRPPRWSWEIEDILEADLHELPRNISPRAARWIEAALARMEGHMDERE